MANRNRRYTQQYANYEDAFNILEFVMIVLYCVSGSYPSFFYLKYTAIKEEMLCVLNKKKMTDVVQKHNNYVLETVSDGRRNILEMPELINYWCG
jgi:hypothetical protein